MADEKGTYQFCLASLGPPPRFQETKDVKAFLNSITATGVVSNVTYLGVSLPKADIAEPYILTTYPQEWQRHYLERRYFSVDPAISAGMSGLLPFDWHSTVELDQPSARFFNEAVEFGLGWNGLSIPIRGAHGDKALFSINSPLLDRDWDHFKGQHVGELTIFAYLFHLRVLEFEGISPAPQKRFVRPREREVLQWAARGKSSWETARILGLSMTAYPFSRHLHRIRDVCSGARAKALAPVVSNGLNSWREVKGIWFREGTPRACPLEENPMPKTSVCSGGEDKNRLGLAELIAPVDECELEALAASAIREHRRKLARAEDAYEAWMTVEGQDTEHARQLKIAYIEAMLDSHAHMNVVEVLVDKLGSIPSVDDDDGADVIR